MASKKTAMINIRVEEELKAELERLAAADERPLSSYVLKILRAHVAKKQKSS